MPVSDQPKSKPKTRDRANVEGELYKFLKPAWTKVSPLALMGDTEAMRKQRLNYLPKEELESDEDYDIRLQHSFLHNGYRDTIEKCVAKPFSREIVLKNPNDRIEPLRNNADRRGTSLSAVLQQFFKDGLNYGVGHLLVDLPNMDALAEAKKAEAPPVEEPQKEKPKKPPDEESDEPPVEDEEDDKPSFEDPEEGNGLTLADDAERLFPFLSTPSPLDIIWWDVEEGEDGQEELTEIHVRDYVIRRSKPDSYEQTVFERIRIYTKDGWEVVEAKKGSTKFEIKESGKHSFGQVPLFSWYFGEKLGLLAAKPPYINLADLNIALWQSQSQQRNYLRYIRIGVLFLKGMTQEEFDKQSSGEGKIKLGPTNVLVSEHEHGDAKFLEHEGTAYEAGAKDIRELKSEMAISGLQVEIEGATGDPTATGKGINEAKFMTRLQMGAKMCAQVATEALRAGATAAGSDPGEEFALEIYTDFGINIDNIQKVDKILQSYKDGLISAIIAVQELQRYGILNERLDPEEVAAEAQEEKSARSLESLGIDPEDPNNPNGDPENPEDPFGGGGPPKPGEEGSGKDPTRPTSNVPRKKFKTKARKTPFNKGSGARSM